MATKAARYLRVSTGRQGCSLERQAAATEAYAQAHGLEIVRTYSDGARSGLDIEGRPAMQQLLQDVHAGDPPFTVILVYDVSRWGRFQDSDEAAYYEQVCKRAGAVVLFVTEPLGDESSGLAQVMKSIRRVMAAEFSRDNSQKVCRAQVKLAKEGYLQGGMAAYGLRRVIAAKGGRPALALQKGEHKSYGADRTVLTAGPAEEVEVVRRIFHYYAELYWRTPRICQVLNAEGIPSPSGGDWQPSGVRAILRNERYAGVMTYGKTTRKLRSSRRVTPRSEWICTEGAFPPIVSPALFAEALRVRRKRRGRFTDQQLLAPVKAILGREGRLERSLIALDKEASSPTTLIRRFGSIIEVYRLLGYARDVETARAPRSKASRRLSDAQMLDRLAALLAREGYLSSDLIQVQPDLPWSDAYRRRFGSLRRAYDLIGYTGHNGRPSATASARR